MSEPTKQGVDDFFENVGGGGPLPSAKLSNIDDFVVGEVLDQFKVEVKDFATGDVVLDKKTKEPVMQLVVVLQTDHRNWENVAKVPLSDKDDKKSPPLDPSEDEGKRAVYIRPFTNIHAAVRDAIVASVGKPQGIKTGAKFGVKVVDLEDTGKGNPKKVHKAMYEAPAAGGEDFFGGGQQPAQAQAAPAAQAPAQQAAPAQSAPAGQDPWGAQRPAAGSQPPF